MGEQIPIGIFDSGYGGLTVYKSIKAKLPQYDYIYLGDNARSPYGDHSFDTVYRYTLQSVEWLFKQGCPLVILACNTASAKALRSIQQLDLPKKYPRKRVLGVIRPTAEVIGNYSESKEIGIFGTNGTVKSASYPIEISHFFPALSVHQQACPLFVPLIESGAHLGEGTDYFIKQYLDQLMDQGSNIDCILLACTHYPLLIPKIEKFIHQNIKLISQGDIVADSLANYLYRHQEMDSDLSKMSRQTFYTTGDEKIFEEQGSIFLGKQIQATHVNL